MKGQNKDESMVYDGDDPREAAWPEHVVTITSLKQNYIAGDLQDNTTPYLKWLLFGLMLLVGGFVYLVQFSSGKGYTNILLYGFLIVFSLMAIGVIYVLVSGYYSRKGWNYQFVYDGEKGEFVLTEKIDDDRLEYRGRVSGPPTLSVFDEKKFFEDHGKTYDHDNFYYLCVELDHDEVPLVGLLSSFSKEDCEKMAERVLSVYRDGEEEAKEGE